ncbi:MAG TPA: T9SS type A sorting domain-containing protein [Bacteroidota bacterium]|nr:T9SS type A sorting domain-containing protein [Bacteroidota bacterium]
MNFLRNSAEIAALLVALFLLIGSDSRHPGRSTMILLPGTQPTQIAPIDNALTCRGCHYYVDSTKSVMIHKDWSGSMMAQAARDPIFYASLTVLAKIRPGDGEFCIRCHSPAGWLEGRSEVYTGQVLFGTDLDGVQCDYCHRAVDPLNPDTSIPPMQQGPVPGYGNGMHAVQFSDSIKRGPYRDAVVIQHKVLFDTFQETSNLCGVCHDVSNPNHITPAERSFLPPYAYAPIERTYSEWLMSSYAQLGDGGTCQSCHMRDTTGYACKYFADVKLRPDIARHDLTGGNTFAPDIIPDFYAGLDTDALQRGKMRATAALQRASTLGVTAYHSGDSVLARVRITNLTGHKLPTGYPEGRRMWINLIATDIHHDTVFETGMYDPSTGIFQRDSLAKVYEAVPGLSADTAAAYGLSPGASFHFFVDDTLLKDNRIPPKGFTNIGFLQRLAQPVGIVYADSQYWDDTWYTLPKTATTVSVAVMYQTIRKEYIDFLRDENNGNPNDWNSWGSRLYTSWQNHGRSQPVIMNSATVPVSDSVDAVRNEKALPLSTRLLQNFPNPFNPATTITFMIDRAGPVRLDIFDIRGDLVATPVEGFRPSGSYAVRFDAGRLASGIYFYRLRTPQYNQTRKMLLLK